MRSFIESTLDTKSFLQEKIYGNMATVYHRTSISDLVNKVYTSGFKPGSGAMYGRGFYSTYELESQMGDRMVKTYGPIVIKFAVPIQTFLVFDYEEFKKSPNFNKLEKPDKESFLLKQFEYFKMNYTDFSFEKFNKSKFSSDSAQWCYENIHQFTNLCEGIIYTGRLDGHCLVSYNTNLIVPLSYTVDEGKTWEEVELNREYLKKVAKVKNRFIPDLTFKPEDFGILNYSYNENGTISASDDVFFKGSFKKLPLKFEYVDYNFSCRKLGLISLEGAPRIVGGHFNCTYNSLRNLENSPHSVRGSYSCGMDNLSDLKGSPDYIGEGFSCDGATLKNLLGGPQDVGKGYSCSNCSLTSLEGAPKDIKGDFICVQNKLKSFKGSPEKIEGDFHCGGNDFQSLDGCPKQVGGNFIVRGNKTKQFTEEEIRAVCDVGGKVIL